MIKVVIVFLVILAIGLGAVWFMFSKKNIQTPIPIPTKTYASLDAFIQSGEIDNIPDTAPTKMSGPVTAPIIFYKGKPGITNKIVKAQNRNGLATYILFYKSNKDGSVMPTNKIPFIRQYMGKWVTCHLSLNTNKPAVVLTPAEIQHQKDHPECR